MHSGSYHDIEGRCREVLPEALLQMTSITLLSFCVNWRNMPFTSYFPHPVPMHICTPYCILYTSLGCTRDHASFMHLRLNPTPGRPPVLSKPLNKHGTRTALLSHEDRTPCSVCPTRAWLCSPAEMAVMLSGMHGCFIAGRLPEQHYMPAGRVDRLRWAGVSFALFSVCSLHFFYPNGLGFTHKNPTFAFLLICGSVRAMCKAVLTLV